MKIWSTEHTFDHPWETIVHAAWRKYPNPFNPAVEGIDVVDRKVDKNGILKSHRVLTTRWGFPDWASKILGLTHHCYVSEVSDVNVPAKYMCVRSHNLVGGDNCGYGSEHSEVDPRKKLMTLRARNLTFCNVINIEEKLVYSQHPEDKTRTQLKQEAIVTVHGVPLGSYLENLVTDTISANATKGREAMEFAVNKIKQEAVELQLGAQSTLHSLTSMTGSFDSSSV